MAPEERFAPEKAEADLMRRRAAAIAKRLRGEWTFQTPVAERETVNEMSTREDGTVDREAAARRAEGRASATDQYSKGYGKLSGISREEIAEIRSRGPKRGDDGEYVPTTQSEPAVPSRSRETYQAPAKLGKPFATEEHEKGEWRRNYPVEVRTEYRRGEDQEAIKLGVDEVAEVTDAGAKPTKRLTRSDAPLGVDTSGAEGGTYGGSEAGHEIFAMDTKGDIYATDPKLKRNAQGRPVLEPDASGRPVLKKTHHSSLVHGEDVIGAGEIEVKKGIVTDVTDLSGHYLPSPAQMADTVSEMEAQGVPMIDPDTQKRATVKLKGHQKATGKKTEMTFETFSQTGGNVEQIQRKQRVTDELEGVARKPEVRPPGAAGPSAPGRPDGAYMTVEEFEQEREEDRQARISDPKELLSEAKRRRKAADEEAAQKRAAVAADDDDAYYLEDSDDEDEDSEDEDEDEDSDDEEDEEEEDSTTAARSPLRVEDIEEYRPDEDDDADSEGSNSYTSTADQGSTRYDTPGSAARTDDVYEDTLPIDPADREQS